MRSYDVPIEFEGLRLDLFLAKKLPAISRSTLQKIIDGGRVKVDGKVKIKPSYQLSHNQTVEVDIPAPKRTEVSAEEIPLDVVYEDSDLIVINKPAEMVVHPAQGHKSGTLVNALLHHCTDLSGIGGVERPGIVHRLDKETSGLMVVAKNDFTHEKLSKMFQDRLVTKKYLALVHGVVKEDEGTIEEPIGRSTSDRKKMAVINIKTDEQIKANAKRPRKLKSRNAITHFKVLKRYKDKTLLELKLETGRTHQIRVHLSHIHHPIVGDKIYGLKKDKTPEMALHSYYLSFMHPRTGEVMEFTRRKEYIK